MEARTLQQLNISRLASDTLAELDARMETHWRGVERKRVARAQAFRRAELAPGAFAFGLPGGIFGGGR